MDLHHIVRPEPTWEDWLIPKRGISHRCSCPDMCIGISKEKEKIDRRVLEIERSSLEEASACARYANGSIKF